MYQWQRSAARRRAARLKKRRARYLPCDPNLRRQRRTAARKGGGQ